MKDLELIKMLASRLDFAAQAGGWKDVNGNFYGVSQKQQPTQQGVPTVPQIFFQHLFDIAFGYPIIGYSYDETSKIYTATETQLTETTFQISALVLQNPSDLTIPTPSDVVNFLRAQLVSRQSLLVYRNSLASVLRISNVRNDYFEDDRHRNEATPNFDIVFTHQREISYTVDSVKEADENVYVIQEKQG